MHSDMRMLPLRKSPSCLNPLAGIRCTQTLDLVQEMVGPEFAVSIPLRGLDALRQLKALASLSAAAGLNPLAGIRCTQTTSYDVTPEVYNELKSQSPCGD